MTRQFAVFANPSTKGRDEVPFILVLQSHHLSAFDTVVVAPLMRCLQSRPNDPLLVRVEVNGELLTLNVALIANIQGRGLRAPVASLADHEDQIRRAIDRLFTGF